MWHIESRGSTPSTNADVAEQARAGAPEGVVLVTDHQQAGRGRLDRLWETPPGTALTMSVLLRPTVPAERWPWLPLLTGVAVLDGLDALGVRAELKWPNDVLLEGRKLAGILAERVETPTGPAAVVGIGLNVAMTEDELPVETATSLAVEGYDADRDAVRDAVLAALADRYRAWLEAGDDDDLRTAYVARCISADGRALRVELPDGSTLTGIGVDVTDGGELVLELRDGSRHRVAAGDVVHVRAGE